MAPRQKDGDIQSIRGQALDGSGIYRQAIGGAIRDFGIPRTNEEWIAIRDIARSDIIGSGALRAGAVDEKMLDMVISEYKERVKLRD